MAISRLTETTLQAGLPKFDTFWDGRSAVGSMEPISAITLSAAQSSVEFNNIPGTYSHLQVRYMSKSTYTTGTSDSLYANFNNDTSANYAYHFLRGNGTAASSSGEANTTFLWLGNQGNTGTGMTSIFGIGVCDILDYANTSKNKTIRSLQGYDSNGDGFCVLSSSHWRSLNAVSSIKFTFGNGNIAINSSFTLYGIK